MTVPYKLMLIATFTLGMLTLGCNTSEAYRRGFNFFWDTSPNRSGPVTFSVAVREDIVGRDFDDEKVSALIEGELSRTGHCRNGYRILEKGRFQGSSAKLIKGECNESAIK